MFHLVPFKQKVPFSGWHHGKPAKNSGPFPENPPKPVHFLMELVSPIVSGPCHRQPRAAGTAEETAWELAREGRRKGFLMEPCALAHASAESRSGHRGAGREVRMLRAGFLMCDNSALRGCAFLPFLFGGFPYENRLQKKRVPLF